jgi:hypothetical protein
VFRKWKLLVIDGGSASLIIMMKDAAKGIVDTMERLELVDTDPFLLST